MMLFAVICCYLPPLAAVCCYLVLLAATNAPKMLVRWVQEAPNAPRMSPRRSQKAPKAPRMVPEGPQRVPKCRPGTPKCPLGGPWEPSRDPFGQQFSHKSPFWSLFAPSGLQNGTPKRRKIDEKTLKDLSVCLIAFLFVFFL